MADGPVRTTRDGPVLEVVLDRPPANAIDSVTSRILGETFLQFRDDADLRVAIVAGGGEKFFSAGWDLKAAAAGEPPDVDYGVGGFGGMQQLPGLNKPVISAVNGIAVGGGLELAISADIVIAVEHARFALPEIKSGTLADAATIRLPKRIPYHVAMEMLFTGRWMDAEEALRWGLINHVVPAEQLMARARELAASLASGPPLVFAATKEVARESENMTFAEAIDRVTKHGFPTVAKLYTSEDQKEGARAFAEKRAPRWKGR